MSEPVSVTDELTTAEALGRFACELIEFDEIDHGIIQELVVEAAKRLFVEGLVVKRNV